MKKLITTAVLLTAVSAQAEVTLRADLDGSR